MGMHFENWDITAFKSFLLEYWDIIALKSFLQPLKSIYS